jgi:hypothetical protein
MENRPLGILRLDTRFPRIPGDIANPASYSFPVTIKVVPNAVFSGAERVGDREVLALFLEAALELEADGVFAVTTSCGFLSQYQSRIAGALKVPVFLSSLLQIPLAHRMTGRRVGVITARAVTLTDEHLKASGWTPDIPLAVGGLEGKPHFAASILADAEDLSPEHIQNEVMEAARELMEKHPDIGSFVFECHNLAPYAGMVAEAFQKPVFDIVAMAHWVQANVFKRGFARC